MRVIVVGGGIWGLACAYACAKRGDQVSIYEAGTIGGGASGGIVGALAPHVPDLWEPKKQFQFEALDSAADFWTAVDDVSGISSGYGRIGRVQPLMTKKAVALAHARTASAVDLWHGRYRWEIAPCPAYISESVAPFGVIHDTFSARIMPAQACRSLAQACTALGVSIFTEHPVTRLKDRGVSGPWGEATGDIVLVAAGVGGVELTDPFFPREAGPGVKGQAALFDIALHDLPQIYAGGVYIIPHENGSVAVGSTSETIWDNGLETDEKLDDVIARASAILPKLKDAKVIQRWAGVRPKARRRDPMLGQIPGLEAGYCAAGGFRVGIGLAHKVGGVMAAMVRGEVVDLPKSFTVDWHMAK